jgi:integrase
MLVAWDANRRPGLQSLLDELQKERSVPEWSLNDLEHWLKDDQEKAVTTVKDRLTHTRFMESWPAQPVMMHGTRYQFLMSGRLFYAIRKAGIKTDDGKDWKVKPATADALKKDLKTLKALGKFLGVPPNVWPVAPAKAAKSSVWVPTPEQVYELLHTDWTKDPKRSIENQWMKHVLAVPHFGTGLRSPKEVWVMKPDAWDSGAGILRVIEPKKNLRERLVYVEPTWLGHGSNRPSYDSWLGWRDRLDRTIGINGKAMFPNPLTGEDFPSPEAFKQFLDGRVKKRYPWFHGYLARHWSVYARLIDGGLTDTNYNTVAEWHGHESVDMTRDTYGPGARAYSKSPKYGVNWLSRAMAVPRRVA